MSDPFIAEMERRCGCHDEPGEPDLLPCGHPAEYFDERENQCVHLECVLAALVRRNKRIAKAFQAIGECGKIQ